MKKFDFTLWSDAAFTLFCSWFIFLCVFRYYRIELLPALFLGFCLSSGVAVFVFWLAYSSRQKKFLLQKDKDELEKLTLHLTLCPENKTKQLLSVFEPASAPAYYLFTMQPLSADTIAAKIKEQEGGAFTVYCNKLSPEAEKLCQDFPITVVDEKQIYTQLKSCDALPKNYICGERKKQTFFQRIKDNFSRKNWGRYFTAGLGLCVLSLFSFYPVYYLVGGVFLLLLSLFLRIFGKR